MGMMMAILVAGIAAAVVFTGGFTAVALTGTAIASYSAILGTGGLIGLFGGIGAAGVIGGIIGGWLYSRQATRQQKRNINNACRHERSSTPLMQTTLTENKIHHPIGTLPAKKISQDNPVEFTCASDTSTSLPLLASLDGQNQPAPIALTPNGFLH